MKKKIRLSIIIVNYKTIAFLKNCLSSIYNSLFKKGLMEVIVVENGSGDNIKNLKKVFPEITTIVNRNNIGFSAANNIGVKISKGDYVLLLNPDTVLEKNTIKYVFDFMETNKNAGIVTCKIIMPTGKLDDACHRGFPTPWNSLCHFSGMSNIFPYNKFLNGYHLGYKRMDMIHEIDACSGAFMMIRKTAGGQVAWFDEDYFWYGEDIDFCYRVKSLKWKIFFIPQVQITHFKGISSGIKKHSEKMSSASLNTKLAATHARFEVMRIFYKKFYLKKYPPLLFKIIQVTTLLMERCLTLKYKFLSIYAL